MAVNYEFYEEKAMQWKSSVETLNDQTDAKLQEVTQCITEIKSESSGNMVDQLINIASQLTSGFKDLIHSVRQLVEAVNKIKDAYKKAIQAMLDAGTQLASKMLGGINA